MPRMRILSGLNPAPFLLSHSTLVPGRSFAPVATRGFSSGPCAGASRMDEVKLKLRAALHVVLYSILITPLLVWVGFLFPHLTAKVLGFQVLVELAASMLVILYILEGSQSRKHRESWLDPLRSRLTIALTIFLAYSWCSALMGVDLTRSLWGFMDRQDGLILLLHLLAWLLVLSLYFRDGHRVPGGAANQTKPQSYSFHQSAGLSSYVRFSFWVSVVVASSGLLEWVWTNTGAIVPDVIKSSVPGRVAGLMGNPMALGPYLILHFFYGIFRLWSVLRARQPSNDSTRRRSGKKVLSLMGGLLVQLTALSLGYTRGVIFGLAFGIVALTGAVSLGCSFPRWIRAGAASLAMLLIVCATGIWVFRDTGTVRNFKFLRRLTQVLPSENLTTKTRIMTWNSALDGVWDYPWLGWGHGNVYYPLNKYYDPQTVRFEKGSTASRFTWSDKSHSAYVDLLVEKGAVGVLLFVVLLYTLVRSLWNGKDRLLSVCLLGGFTSYGVSILVAFDSFGSLFAVFLFLAVVVYTTESEPTGRRLPEVEPATKPRKKRPVNVNENQWIGVLAISGCTVLLIWANLQIGLANRTYLQAMVTFPRRPDYGISLYDRAFQYYSPYVGRHKLNCANLAAQVFALNPQSLGRSRVIDLVSRMAEEAVAAHPGDVAIHMTLNDIYNGIAQQTDKRLLKIAETYGLKALELSPRRQEAMVHLGRTYLLKEEPDRAVELNRRMVAVYSDFPVAHWLLGLSLSANEQVEEAKAEIREAFRLGYRLQGGRDENAIQRLFTDQELRKLGAAP